MLFSERWAHWLGHFFFTLVELNVPTGATAILDLIRHWNNVDIIINYHEIVKKSLNGFNCILFAYNDEIQEIHFLINTYIIIS